MNQADVGPLLSASSVMLAAFGFAYNSWRQDLEDAAQNVVPEEMSRVEKRRDTLLRTIRLKALPLALASTAVAILFLPDALSIVHSAIISGGQYDALRATLVTMELFWLLIAGSMLRLTWKVSSRISALTTTLRSK